MGKRSIILLLLLFSEYAFSQNQTAVSLEQQETLLQGYWAYSNSETDELFILKLKIFSRSPEHIYVDDGYVVAGSYLYKKGDNTISDNLSEINDYLLFSTSKEFFDFIRQPSHHYDMPMLGNTLDSTTIRVFFYDKTKGHDHGEVELTILSSVSGKEQMHWNLHLQDCVELILEGGLENLSEEEINRRFFSFSVPTDMVLTKVHDLQLFKNKGVALAPIPGKH